MPIVVDVVAVLSMPVEVATAIMSGFLVAATIVPSMPVEAAKAMMLLLLFCFRLMVGFSSSGNDDDDTATFVFGFCSR